MIKSLTSYYQDWLIPELATSILQLILEDESGKFSPEVKVDALLILHSKFSTTLKFGKTTLHESYHNAIMNHLEETSNAIPACKIEVCYITNFIITLLNKM